MRSLVLLVVCTIPDFGSPEVEIKFLKNSENFLNPTTFAREMLERLNLVKKGNWFCSGKIRAGVPPIQEGSCMNFFGKTVVINRDFPEYSSKTPG